MELLSDHSQNGIVADGLIPLTSRYIRHQAFKEGSTGGSGDAVMDATERRQKGRKRVVRYCKCYASIKMRIVVTVSFPTNVITFGGDSMPCIPVTVVGVHDDVLHV